MLELPESCTIAAQANAILAGKRIEAVQTMQTPHRFAFFFDSQEAFPRLLTGRTIQSACHRGGIVEFDTEDGFFYFSDGGSPHYYASEAVFPKTHQLLIRFDDGSGLGVSVQMYAHMGAHAQGDCGNSYYRSSSDKPDPLGPDFTDAYFHGLWASAAADGKLSVKAFLATEQRIPGLGNGVLQDILWNAGLSPRCDMKTLTDAEFETLYLAVRDTLRDMCDQGGRSTEKDLLGQWGGYPSKLCKNTLGSPCPRCGAAIEKAAYMGGTVYFCPSCQRR